MLSIFANSHQDLVSCKLFHLIIVDKLPLQQVKFIVSILTEHSYQWNRIAIIAEFPGYMAKLRKNAALRLPSSVLSKHDLAGHMSLIISFAEFYYRALSKYVNSHCRTRNRQTTTIDGTAVNCGATWLDPFAKFSSDQTRHTFNEQGLDPFANFSSAKSWHSVAECGIRETFGEQGLYAWHNLMPSSDPLRVDKSSMSRCWLTLSFAECRARQTFPRATSFCHMSIFAECFDQSCTPNLVFWYPKGSNFDLVGFHIHIMHVRVDLKPTSRTCNSLVDCQLLGLSRNRTSHFYPPLKPSISPMVFVGLNSFHKEKI